MKNYVSDGKTVTVTAPAAVTSGDPVRIAALLGIAQNDAASGASVVLALEGVFMLPKATGTLAVGVMLDYDDSAGNFDDAITPAAGDIEDCAIVLEAAASGDATVKALLLSGRSGSLN